MTESKYGAIGIIGCNKRTTLNAYIEETKELEQYRAIGTVEEFAYAKRKVHIAELATEHIDKMEKTLKDYEAIGTIERFRELTEKAEPKKPFQPFGTHSYKCPNCWKFVAHEVDDNCDLEGTMAGWCPFCGQCLDWD